MKAQPETTVSMPGSVQRIVGPDRRVRTKTLAALLVKHGVIDPAAIEDPEGYDNYRTWDGLNATARELTQAANNQADRSE